MQRPNKRAAKSKSQETKAEGFFQLRFDSPVAVSTPSTSVTLSELSQDGRRIHERTVPFVPPSPEKHRGTNSLLSSHSIAALWEIGSQDYMGMGMMDVDGNIQAFEEDVDLGDFEQTGAPVIQLEGPLQTGRRYVSSDNPFFQLKAEAATFLKELIGLDGRGSEFDVCGHCGSTEGVVYRCRSCSQGMMFCGSCILSKHKDRPLDCVEKWNGAFFETIWLKTLGLVVQKARKGFVVVDIDFVQEVDVQFCLCQRREVVGEFYQQLLRKSLFPATVSNPHTAFTFRAVRYFHVLTLTGKISMYDFYSGAERCTDGSGLKSSKERYDEFLRVIRLWRFLKPLKRGGVQPSPTLDLSAIPAGQLTVKCPACPRPGVNLPPGWEELVQANPDAAFLFFKFILVDACFCLKHRTISSEQKDPGLFTGKAYFVEQKDYQALMQEMKKKPDREEEAHCLGSTLSSIAQANTKFSKGYTQTGVMLCLCARHEMVEPNGTADPNKGER
ncbi:hypothetical protein V5O48_013496, partial [Marasmius crinis-equi]